MRLGFINHWYPPSSATNSRRTVQGIQICGVPIVLRRAEGKVYALKDQCVHRGVRMSEKKMCFNKQTISCWYHGFTFDLKDGKLSTIVANPNDKLVGTTGVTTYPVHEVAGMIFVFVREDNYPDEDVPPLAQDLPFRFPENSERFPHLWPAAPSVLDETPSPWHAPHRLRQLAHRLRERFRQRPYPGAQGQHHRACDGLGSAAGHSACG
jgi:phenylpropionate dioxygenase-like ring-hydroxylating dioxygenase large terminal subunit